MEKLSNRDWLRMLSGDNGALEQLHDRIRALIFVLGLRCGNSPDDLDDVSEALYLHLTQNWRVGLRGYSGAGNFNAWLEWQCRGALSHHIRGNDRCCALSVRYGRHLSSECESSVESGASEVAWSILATLTPENRSLVMDRTLLGQSYCEIARMRGISEAAARKAYERAIRQARSTARELQETEARQKPPSPTLMSQNAQAAGS
jgi:RNA polymerase sigma factor (sigma-70 family)